MNLYINIHNFAINKNYVFQGENLLNFFHIHCELISNLLMKTAKKRGGQYALVFALTLGIPYPLLKGQRSNQN